MTALQLPHGATVPCLLLAASLLLLLQPTEASPVLSVKTAYTSVLQSANCGEHADVMIGVTDQVHLNSTYLLEQTGNLPAGCVVSWRIDITISEDERLQNYGVLVEGTVELEDPANVEKCSSSRLLITDRDETGDMTATTKKVCGTDSVSYTTYQDTVTVILTVSPDGAQGSGFSLTFSPVFVCGGHIDGSLGKTKRIQTPNFPEPYPLDLFCFWSVSAPKDVSIKIVCPRFILPRRNKKSGACGDYLMVHSIGVHVDYCGKEIMGSKNSVTLEGPNALLMFRSAGRYNSAPGFVCDIKFE